MRTFELSPIYSGQKSFGGKAKIVVYDNCIDLISYDTVVARINNGKVKVYGYFSQTTAKHINEFLQQYGFAKMTKKEMELKQEWGI